MPRLTTLTPSFPRKRESRDTHAAVSLALDPRLREDDDREIGGKK
jgi:hypothetical protein